ncbi:MAG: luciferase [Halobacteriaceae archaeon]
MTRSAAEGAAVVATGLDGVALKPTEHDLDAAADLPAATTVVIDYEGADSLPAPETLAGLAADRPVRVTTPVRANGFDPLGDDSLAAAVPERAGRVLVAGHEAYLDAGERARAVAPRLQAAAADCEDPWVGTEGIERLALATGHTQFELLAPSTERDIRALRAAGFDGEIAVYAPVVLSTDENTVLDALGAYAARRGSVAADLPERAPTDSRVGGGAREALLEGCRNYALCGEPARVRRRVGALADAGADSVVGYPAAGLDGLL